MTGTTDRRNESVLPARRAYPAWKRRTMGSLLLLGMAVALAFLLLPRGTGTQGVAVGSMAPDFTLKTLDGKD